MSLKICVSLITFSMILGVIRKFECFWIYRSPMIFKYDLNIGRQELIIEFKLIFVTIDTSRMQHGYGKSVKIAEGGLNFYFTFFFIFNLFFYF